MTARAVPTLPTWVSGTLVTQVQMLALNVWLAFWANPPMFRMYQSISQSLPSAVYTQLALDTQVDDTDSGRASSSPWTYTIPAGMTGRWQFSVGDGFVSSSSGVRVTALYQNGADISQTIGPPASGVSTDMAGRTVTIPCAGGDTIALYGWQNTGSALSTDVGVPASASYLEGRLVSLGTP